MALMELYPQIKSTHIVLVQASGAWMALRFLMVLAGARWPHHLLARGIAWTIDGLLVTFAAMLLTILPAQMFANGWIWAKLIPVLGYFAFGYAGLTRRRKRSSVAILFILAAVCYCAAYGIARMHDPRGWFLLLNP